MHSACDDNEFRDGRGEDVIRRKRSDTRVDSIEATYRVDLHARGDMLLGTLLAERGFELQSQLITAYQGRLKVSVRPTPHRACCPGVSVRGCRDDVSGKICPEKCGMLGQLLGPQAVAQVLKLLWESVFGEQKGLA
jgi:hypothetical protein